jgi:hypothetical protein
VPTSPELSADPIFSSRVENEELLELLDVLLLLVAALLEELEFESSRLVSES